MYREGGGGDDEIPPPEVGFITRGFTIANVNLCLTRRYGDGCSFTLNKSPINTSCSHGVQHSRVVGDSPVYSAALRVRNHMPMLTT